MSSLKIQHVDSFSARKSSTGEVWEACNFADRPNFEQVRNSNLRVQKIDLHIETPREQVMNILRVISPSVSELGTILKVSRQAIYKWKNGECELDEGNLDRVRRLNHIAKKFSLAKVSNPMPLLKAKAFNGLSALELFQHDKLNDRQISELINEGKLMQQAYKSSSEMISMARASEDWRATISIPGVLSEEK